MATYTNNYNLRKPTQAEQAQVLTINNNMDDIDSIMYATQSSIAPPYDSTESYTAGDRVMYELYLYEANADTTGTWDGTKWDRVYSAEKESGGVNYSTTEQPIGTWIDGSTLYQKTISLNSPISINANSWGTVDTLSDFIQIIECNGLNEDNGEFVSYPLGSNCDSNNEFSVLNLRNTAIDIKYITIKYLKPSV